MKRTITTLASNLGAALEDIRADAEHLANLDCLPAAEAALALRDAQRCLRAAQDALRLALVQRTDGQKSEDQK